MNPPARLPELFQQLPSHEHEVILSKLKPVQYRAGEVLFNQGDDGSELIFVTAGKVKITRVSEEGRELLITYLGAGDFVGELTVLTGQTRNATVTAISDLSVQEMSKEDFLSCLNSSEFSRVFMSALAWRLHSSSERFSDLVLYNIYRNLCETLRQLAQLTLIDGEEHLIVESRPTHQELAALLGSSREVITRTLQHLQRDGLLRVEGKRVYIL